MTYTKHNPSTVQRGLMLTLGVLLTACAHAPAPAPKIAEPSKAELGIWQVHNCTISAERAGAVLSTEGHESNHSIHLKLTTPRPAAMAPRLTIWGIGGFQTNFDGNGNAWGFEFPTDPTSVANIITDKVFIMVEYTPQPTPGNPITLPIKHVFPAKGLPEALLWQKQGCHS